MLTRRWLPLLLPNSVAHWSLVRPQGLRVTREVIKLINGSTDPWLANPIPPSHRVEGRKTHLNILLSRSQALEVITFSGQLTFSISGPRSRHVLESQHSQHSQHSLLSAGLFLWQAPRREHACRCIGRWHPMALWHWAHDLLFFMCFWSWDASTHADTVVVVIIIIHASDNSR